MQVLLITNWLIHDFDSINFEKYILYKYIKCRKLFDKFDLNDDGEIQYEELLSAITPPLIRIRRDLVVKVFKKLDKDESGVIDSKDVCKLYNAKQHPDVKSGKRTE